MNMPTFIVLAIVVIITAIVVYRMIRQGKSGGGCGCGCGCSGCSGCDTEEKQ